MKVKSKIVARYEDRDRLKAVATVCLDGKFLITGVRVSDCRKGLTVFMQAKAKLAEVFSHKSGEGFVDTALKILISVVVGALLLAGLYTLFKDTILPTLTQKITSLFNYQG